MSLLVGVAATTWAQRIRPPTPVTPVQATVTNPAPPATLSPNLGAFDPYAGAGVQMPPTVTLPGTAGPGATTLQTTPYAAPAQPGPLYPQTTPGYPGQAPVVGSPYPSQTPSAVFPGSTWPNNCLPSAGWPGSMPPYQRLFTDTGFEVEWLQGDEGRELQILSIDVNTTANWMKFPFHRDPLKIKPGLTLRWLDGPDAGAFDPLIRQPPDVPSRVYDAYLDFTWEPKLQRTTVVEGFLNARIGVYSDFNAINVDSVRLTGTGLGIVNLTETLAVKGGIVYLDRAKIKMLPAAGIVWRPNDRAEFDLYFPEPKAKMYLTTLGTAEIWWYVGGEYGGGSWSIEEAGKNPASERMDVNDLRAFGGLEWTHPNDLQGFVEAGYVWDREIIVVNRPASSVPLKDTMMIRGGLRF